MNETAVIRQLNAFIELAKERGVEIRRELLAGTSSGVCEIRGKPCLFLDISAAPAEQLETIRNSLSTLTKTGHVSPGTSI